jgi:hypothetical protein
VIIWEVPNSKLGTAIIARSKILGDVLFIISVSLKFLLKIYMVVFYGITTFENS